MGRSVRPEDATPEELAQAQQMHEVAYGYWVGLKTLDAESWAQQPNQHPLAVSSDVLERLHAIDAEALRMVLIAILSEERVGTNKLTELFKRAGQ